MKIALLTNEYPPHIYGGAGVHVEYLTAELARLPEHDIQVLCFGDQRERLDRLTVEGIASDYALPAQDPRHRKFLDTLFRDILMAGSVPAADIVHCHTWYSHLAGCLVKQLAGARLVLTTHSLEPHRPWKAEQLGTAYRASTWIERTAYANADGVIAVSQAMRADVHELYGVPYENIRVIHNGIDLNQFRPVHRPDVLVEYGVNPDKPFILFVGRVTRQKGIIHLVNAIKHIRPAVQVVLCAGAPDTAEIGEEMADRVAQAREESENGIIWITKMLSKDELAALYSHAALFVCPSVYEPFGIINLEAMACETPVVAAAVGGIPEVVVDNETGVLVPIAARGDGDFEPRDPDQFSHDLAEGVSRLLDSPATLRAMGAAARARVEQHFSWTHIAQQTAAFYADLLRG